MYLNQNHATKCVEAGFYHWVKEETHCDTRNHAHCQCELNAPWAFDGFHVCIFRNWCEVAFAYQTEIVVNGYHAKEQGYNSKHEVTGFDTGGEDHKLPDKAPGWWQATQGNHKDEQSCRNQWGTFTHPYVFLHVGGAGCQFHLGRCDKRTDVGKGIG